MKPKTPSLLTVLLLALAAPGPGAAVQPVRVEGSSAGLAISQAAADEFQHSHATVKVDIGLSGSGGALGRLCRGDVDLVHSARPIVKTEIDACRTSDVQFIELPLAFDAVTVVVNRKNGFVESLTLAELRTMWDVAARGKVVRWSQVNARFPDAPLKLFAPDWQFESSSYFASVLFGPGRSARSDVMSSVDDNLLVQGVARDVNTLSYVSMATYLDNRAKLRAVPIAPSAGAEAVAPSPETIASGQYRPLSRPIFLYVNVRALVRPEAAAFSEYYIANAARLARSARYVPLADSTYRTGQERLRRRIAGSVWGGAVPIGLTVEELQKRSAL
jgi:phosphate transport system substrate-binding protein